VSVGVPSPCPRTTRARLGCQDQSGRREMRIWPTTDRLPPSRARRSPSRPRRSSRMGSMLPRPGWAGPAPAPRSRSGRAEGPAIVSPRMARPLSTIRSRPGENPRGQPSLILRVGAPGPRAFQGPPDRQGPPGRQIPQGRRRPPRRRGPERRQVLPGRPEAARFGGRSATRPADLWPTRL